MKVPDEDLYESYEKIYESYDSNVIPHVHFENTPIELLHEKGTQTWMKGGLGRGCPRFRPINVEEDIILRKSGGLAWWCG